MRMVTNVKFYGSEEVEKAYSNYIKAKMKLERCLSFEGLELNEETASNETDTDR